jgi:DNA-binding response OmpR family regulator
MVKILVVDDEPMIADYLEASLTEMGFEVSGTALTCAAALESIWQDKPDVALVDAQLGSETCEVVLDECAELGIKVIISTGLFDVPEYCAGLPVLRKPYGAPDLAEALLDEIAPAPGSKLTSPPDRADMKTARMRHGG